MSSYADDYEASCRMLEEAARALKAVDPQNTWLQYIDLDEVAVQEGRLVDVFWDELWAYGSASCDLLRLFYKYTEKLRSEARRTPSIPVSV